jgi:hypothetical protein
LSEKRGFCRVKPVCRRRKEIRDRLFKIDIDEIGGRYDTPDAAA